MTIDTAKQRWTLIDEALSGLGGFSDGSHLVQFPREVDTKYEARKSLAYYIDYLSPVVSRFGSYLFKRKALRKSDNDLLTLILDNADNGNNSLDVIMKNFFESAFAKGCMLLMVDMPRELPNTLKEQKETRAVPYVTPIDPSAIYDYKLTNNAFEWVILSYEVETKAPFEKATIATEYHYWDGSVFERRDKDFGVIETIEHGLGICPVLFFTLGSFPHVSMCYNLADITKRIYNARSELDEILRGQTFSLLTYHAPDGSVKPDELKISVDNVLLYANSAPEFIAPSSSPASTYQELIKELEELIDAIGMNPINASSQSQDTGIALQFKLETLNSTLLSMARKLEDFERRIFDVACRWLDIQYDYDVIYPKDFSIADLKTEIENTTALKSLGMPQSWENAKKQELARLDLAGVDDDTLDTIFDDINSQTQEVIDDNSQSE